MRNLSMRQEAKRFIAFKFLYWAFYVIVIGVVLLAAATYGHADEVDDLVNLALKADRVCVLGTSAGELAQAEACQLRNAVIPELMAVGYCVLASNDRPSRIIVRRCYNPPRHLSPDDLG